MTSDSIFQLIEKAIQARTGLFDAQHESAFRLFNGFTEGNPNLVLDLYARTLLIHNYADDPTQGKRQVEQAAQFLQSEFVWLRAGVVKTRNASAQEERRGGLFFGEKPDTRIKEHNVWYSIDLMMNRDSSLYLDTRNLRKWLIENMQDNTVLNMFAYTGSLGVAALAGGAGAHVLDIGAGVGHLALPLARYEQLAADRVQPHGLSEPVQLPQRVHELLPPAVAERLREQSGPIADGVEGLVHVSDWDAARVESMAAATREGDSVVLIHGLGSSGRDWEAQIAPLAARHRERLQEQCPRHSFR